MTKRKVHEERHGTIQRYNIELQCAQLTDHATDQQRGEEHVLLVAEFGEARRLFCIWPCKVVHVRGITERTYIVFVTATEADSILA